MIGTGLAILGGAIIGGGLSLFGASKAASATKRAAATSADAQREALEYLKEREALPQELREKALTKLGGIYDLPGMEGREEFIEGLTEDPFYETAVREGEESVLRGKSATGGLRSGGASEALARVAPDVLKEVYTEQVGGLKGFAGLPSGAPRIAETMKGIGTTEALGISGAGQAWQRGFQDLSDIILSGIGTGIKEGVI